MPASSQNNNTGEICQQGGKPTTSPSLASTSTRQLPYSPANKLSTSDNIDKTKSGPGRPTVADSWTKYCENSLNLYSISEYLNKKRSYTEIEDSEQEQQVTEPSTLSKRQATGNTAGTTDSKKEEKLQDDKMEKILKAIEEGNEKTMNAIDGEALKKQLGTTREDTIAKVVEDAKVKLNTMLTSDKGLSSLHLDSLAEKNEQLQRKSNIIIKGLNLQRDNLLSQINNFMETNFKLRNAALEAFTLDQNHNVVKVKLNLPETKYYILKNKFTALKNTSIYIEADLTPKEAQIAKKIRDIARSKKQEGAKVKIYSSKLLIDNKWWIWKEEVADLIPAPEKPILKALQTALDVKEKQRPCIWANASKATTSVRPSGGLLTAAKATHLQTLEAKYEWIFTKAIINKLSILIGNIYLKPTSDIKENLIGLQKILDDESVNYYDLIIIGGDFNARVGRLQELPKEITEVSVLDHQHESMDIVTNERGKLLTCFMEKNGFILLNGRSPNDKPANFTFNNGNGLSVIDLIWIKTDRLELVTNLEVIKVATESNHQLVLLSLAEALVTQPDVSSHSTIATLTIKWKDQPLESKQTFYLELAHSFRQNSSNTLNTVSQLYDNFCDAIYEAAETASLLSKRSNKITIPKGQQRFDNESKYLKKECNSL
ncbi:hypothetical protein KQX54_013590 [Cotesia glomerata]|uniref:Endonuclease/exonuclease/phosphatase domain-containing protein n=1 Tax=Cotesia glomerata TaxID=32391 RepID=A0AAV7HTB3_COTGL|nr:hypothetical protein KQX54_013590 [Cotesia glomerata]